MEMDTRSDFDTPFDDMRHLTVHGPESTDTTGPDMDTASAHEISASKRYSNEDGRLYEKRKEYGDVDGGETAISTYPSPWEDVAIKNWPILPPKP